MVTIHSPGLPAARELGDAVLDVADRAHAPERREHALQSLAVHVRVAVDQPRHHGLPFEIDDARLGAVSAAIAASDPTARMRSPAIAIACAIVKRASTVMILPFLSTRSAGRAVIVVTCRCLSVRLDTRGLDHLVPLRPFRPRKISMPPQACRPYAPRRARRSSVASPAGSSTALMSAFSFWMIAAGTLLGAA